MGEVGWNRTDIALDDLKEGRAEMWLGQPRWPKNKEIGRLEDSPFGKLSSPA